MKRVLVTGGAGFIGSHAVNAFEGQGLEVLVIDNLSSGNQSNLSSGVRLEELDLGSEEALGVLRAFRPDAIFHYAAQIDVRVSISRPLFDAQENIINSLRILEAASKNGLEYFAFASSGGAIYGEPDAMAQDESHPERPISPYGVAKLSVDKYLNAFAQHCGLPSCSMRFSNVYGPRQNSKGEAGVVSVFIRKALAGQPLQINGSGQQTRDFIYVKDLANAASLIIDKRPQGVLNFGTGVETSIRDLADLVISLVPSSAGTVNSAPIPGEQLRSVLDSTRARGILGWRPSIDLRAGLLETASWFSERPENLNP
jgi:UDP-glucose 4-epimerase